MVSQKALTILFLQLAFMLMPAAALAADPVHGRTLAQTHCVACHAVAPNRRDEVAAAPPFDVIGRKYGFNPERLLLSIIGPHPRMNFSPSPDDAAHLAAYIGSLSK